MKRKKKMKFRKQPVVINAEQWFENGDHSKDGNETFIDSNGEKQLCEGKVVRYFRRPDVSGETPCKHCSKTMHVHGWIDTLEGGHIVCPGDWIITGVKNETYPCKPDVFSRSYNSEYSEDTIVPDKTTESVEYHLNELDVQRISLKENDALMVTIKHDDVNQESLQILQNRFKQAFPFNKTFLFAMGTEGDIKFSVVNNPEVLYCSNCDCGKKELVKNQENQNGNQKTDQTSP